MSVGAVWACAKEKWDASIVLEIERMPGERESSYALCLVLSLADGESAVRPVGYWWLESYRGWCVRRLA